MESFEADAYFGLDEWDVGGEVCTCPFCRRSFDPRWSMECDSHVCSCVKCGHSWQSRISEPLRCPRCGSYRWGEESRSYECRRCGNIWSTTKSSPPAKCPRCRSVYWYKEKEVPRPVPPSMSKSECERYAKAVTEAIKRCKNSRESVFDVCRVLDVSVLEVIIALRNMGSRYRL
ncbi:MAG: hypothetical protein Q4Q62_05215 [Thermoplasmata archaeon]|nr:hypothetical protein [Thermoplasmata archaeon]